MCQKRTKQSDVGFQADSLAKGGNGNFTRCKNCGTLIPQGIIHFGRRVA